MGAAISAPIATLQWLNNESTRILNTVTTIVALTSVVVMGFTVDLTERAENQISMVFMDIEDFLSELGVHGEPAQRCIASKKPELDQMRRELVTSLVSCYKSHERIFIRLQQERNLLKNEAIKLKSDTEAIIASCSGQVESKFTCLNKGVAKLSRRLNMLVRKVEAHTRREFAERRRSVLQLMACDRKAVEQAYSTIQTIVRDVKLCIFHSESNVRAQDVLSQ